MFLPLAAAILIGLRRTGYGRLLYAIGDNPIASRLSGARAWQVLIAVRGLRGHGGDRRDPAVGPDERRERHPGRRLRAAVGCGRRDRRDLDHGRRGNYSGMIVGALILTVLGSLLQSMGFPEAVRQVLYGSIIIVAAAYARVTGET